jgi:molybdopterin/thiamine biosynthesis adenylyltransferase
MAHILVIGAGAVGSHVIPHVARLRQVSRITVVDRDRYEPTNLRGQDISSRDIGRPKAWVQSRRLKRINSGLAVTAVHRDASDLPLGALRADVILSCVDSRRARLVINQAAWRLGVPWIDAGIAGSDLLARVQVFMPGAEGPCMECGWDSHDYEIVEQTYPCQRESIAGATDSPSGLAALAAAIQSIECEKLLVGSAESLAGREVLIDVRHHKHYVSSCRRNPACRMLDHAGWHITGLDASPSSLQLGELIAVGSTLRDADRKLVLAVAVQRIATTLMCPTCDGCFPVFVIERLARQKPPPCARCGNHLQVNELDLEEAVPVVAVPRDAMERPLSQVGLLPGDILSLVTSSVRAHFEVGGRP